MWVCDVLDYAHQNRMFLQCVRLKYIGSTRSVSLEAEIKSLLESVLRGSSHRSHSVLLWDLMGKLGKVMGREELKIYSRQGTYTGIMRATGFIIKYLL